MESEGAARRGPFLVLAAISLIVTIAVFRLPEALVALLVRHRFLEARQATWGLWLIFAAAFVQALYCGFVTFSPERLAASVRRDSKMALRPLPEATRSMARAGASVAGFTLVYGLAAFLVTGGRAGFWLFVTLLAAQGPWHYRQVGRASRFLARQPEVADDASVAGSEGADEGLEETAQPDEVEAPVPVVVSLAPALARGLQTDLSGAFDD